MSSPSIVVLALSTLDSEFQLDESAQRRTWAREDSKEVKVIWVRGGGSHFYEDGDRNLVVPAPEDFGSILAKTLLAIEWINTNLNPDVIVRSNTSSYFQLDKLKKVVNKFQQNQEDFGGYFESYNSERFVNGAGIFLKRSAIEALSQMNPNDWIDIPDDVAISRYLFNHGLKASSLRRNNLAYHHFFFPSHHSRVKGWSNRELTRSRMELIHKFYSSGSLITKIYIYWKLLKLEITQSKLTPYKVLKFLRGGLFRR